MQITLAQIDVVVGDIAGNVRRCRQAIARAANTGSRLVVCPELCLLGYPPDDLLLRPDLHERLQAGLDELMEAARDSGVALIVGAPALDDGRLRNSAWILDGGRALGRADKRCLPNYGVFDEKRYFEPGANPCVVEVDGRRIGVMVCEDMWDAAPARDLAAAGAEVMISLNASPYHWGKREDRRRIAATRVHETGLPLIYVNQVGGQDDLVFDGESFALAADGTEVVGLPPFTEADARVVLEAGTDLRAATGEVVPAAALGEAESIYRALTLGVRDYVGKNGFPGVVVGLSGGIDSALTLAVAVDALGPEAVTAVMMPSRYTAEMSLDDAAAEARALGVQYHVLSIESAFEAFNETLADVFAGHGRDVTEENLQARSRGVLVMALANKFNALVLATGNKSEMAVGYATLYGDMCGGFAPLKDVDKTRVYRLARWRNTQGEVIPERVITRAPSAELAEDQADSDSLPPYEVLDPILEALVERDEAVEDLVARGFAEADVRHVARLLVRSEYKRRQAAPGPKVSPRAFGRERRYPITSRYSF